MNSSSWQAMGDWVRARAFRGWRTGVWLALGVSGALATSALAAEELVVADFEGETYGAWVATGEAFGPGPARGTLPGQMAVSGFKGKGLVNSFFKGDGTTGTLTSPEFKLERPYLGFLIGGGRDEAKLALQLLVGGRVVRSATGPNDRAGGSEALEPASWDVAEFAGQTAVIRIVDQATGGWGHLNVDHLVQTDRKPPGLVRNARRDFTVAGRYLHLPIRNGVPTRKVTLLAGERVVVRNDIGLADDPAAADWWAPMDVGAWKGQKVALVVDQLREDSKALSAVEQGDTIKGAETLYREPLRGQLRFSPQRGWNNDPNGMVYYNGEYHLFFQHNPYGWGWGNMHWGHAVSRDLVHWEELGDKLLPDDLGPMFSGSAVVDWKNTSGFGRDGRPPLVLIYTAAGNPAVQCIAYSTDGRTFTKYSGNPVVPQVTGGNRDPKVMWHEPTGRWVMVLYVEWQKKHTVHFFTSPNLKEWTLASITEGDGPGKRYLFECPDFFELAIDGDAARRKWVLLAADGQYAVGTFDGTRFTPEHSRLPGPRGRGFYAPQTFSDIPAHDGRRIMIGWFQTETKGMPFNQAMTVPFELNLASDKDGPRLTYRPVAELEQLRMRTHRADEARVQPGGVNPLAPFHAELMELRADFAPGTATEVAFELRGATMVYDVAKEELVINGHRAPAPLRQGRQRLIAYVDRTGLEIFASDGLTYVPMPFQPKADATAASVKVSGGPVTFTALEAHELRSIWRSGPKAAPAAKPKPAAPAGDKERPRRPAAR